MDPKRSSASYLHACRMIGRTTSGTPSSMRSLLSARNSSVDVLAVSMVNSVAASA